MIRNGSKAGKRNEDTVFVSCGCDCIRSCGGLENWSVVVMCVAATQTSSPRHFNDLTEVSSSIKKSFGY